MQEKAVSKYRCLHTQRNSPSTPWCRRRQLSTALKGRRTAWSRTPTAAWHSWARWSTATPKWARKWKTSLYPKRPLQSHGTACHQPSTKQNIFMFMAFIWPSCPFIYGDLGVHWMGSTAHKKKRCIVQSIQCSYCTRYIHNQPKTNPKYTANVANDISLITEDNNNKKKKQLNMKVKMSISLFFHFQSLLPQKVKYFSWVYSMWCVYCICNNSNTVKIPFKITLKKLVKKKKKRRVFSVTQSF